jgi:glucosamine--fructose-6-phosphate aminotransferase (isomerizing)
MEYRGYDSAGIATINNGHLERRRAVGKLDKLSDLLVHEPLAGKAGIGHTRWATHGEPNVANTQPHRAGSVAVVHNGIIENYRDLRAELKEFGISHKTDTDTETVALLAQHYLTYGSSPRDAAFKTIAKLEGAFALCFLFEGEPDLLIAARKGSPLAIGHGEGEMFVGSDAIALAPWTDRITYLEEGDSAAISRERFEIFDSDGNEVERPVRLINIEPEARVNPAIRGEASETDNRSTSFDVEIVRTVASGNSVTVYLNLIALEDQVGAFVERVRGSNSLGPNQKDRYLSFLVQLQKNIGDLASSLPDAGEDLVFTA